MGIRALCFLCAFSAAEGFRAPSFNPVQRVPGSFTSSQKSLLSTTSRRFQAPRAAEESSFPDIRFLFDPGTKGGIVFYSIVGTAVPFIVYNALLDNGMDIVTAGNVVLVVFVGFAIVAWTGSYVFRVANKDMTYAQQLRDYENAVIQKRFEELSGEEVDALMGEIYPEKPKPPPS